MDTPRRCLLVTLVWCILQSSCPTFMRSDGVSAALSFIKPLTGLSTGSVQPVSTRPAAVAPSSTGASTANSTAFKARSSSGNAGRAGMGPWRPMSTGVEWSLRRVKSTPSLELIDAARESGAPPDASLYSPALRECRYVGDAARAMELLLEMRGRAEEVPLREGDCIAVMGACAAQNLTAEAVRVFHELMPAWGVPRRQGSYAAIIVACSRGRRWEEAERAFESMSSAGVEADGACFAAMIETYRRQGEVTRAVELYRRMTSQGVPWTSGSLAASMRALVGTGSMQSQQEALQLFHHAATQTSGNNSNGNKKGKDAGPLRLDTGVFAAALEACAELGLGQRAVDLVVQMKAEGLRVAPNLYDIAARACGRGVDWDAALSLLYVMDRHGAPPSDRVYGYAVGACAEAGQWGKALTLVYALDLKGLRLPGRALWLLMRSLLTAGEGERALKMLMEEEAKRRGSGSEGEEGVQMVAGMWASVLVAALEDHQQQQQEEEEGEGVADKALLHLMASCGDKAGIIGFMPEADLGRIIKALCQVGRVASALALVRACHAAGVRVNVIMYTNIINQLAFQGLEGLAEALSVLREMEEGPGLHADAVLLTTLLDACLKLGAAEEAMWLSSRLEQEEAGQAGASGTASLAVRVRECLMRADTRGATLLLKEAVERQVEVPALCFSVVVGAASREGHWQDAIEVLGLMRSQGMQPIEADLTSAIRACVKAGRWEAACRLLEVQRAGGGNSTSAYALTMLALARAHDVV